MKIPHLRGCYDEVGGLVYFGRMIDKVRLHDAGRLPADYHENLGKGFDGRVLRWLRIEYAAFQAEVRRGKGDEELLQWAFATGRKPSPERIAILNGFLIKRGWRDNGRAMLEQRLRDGGYQPGPGTVLTHFDFIDLDEGRPLRFGADPAVVPIPPRPVVEGLRSPYEMLGGLVHLGRMLDKIRLHATGKLPPGHVPSLGYGTGTTFDGQGCRFLNLNYDEVVREVLKGTGTDDAGMMRWIAEHGRALTDEEKETFNGFLAKRGWRDESTERLHFRLREAGMPLDAAPTMFDYIDLDEGRPVRKFD